MTLLLQIALRESDFNLRIGFIKIIIEKAEITKEQLSQIFKVLKNYGQLGERLITRHTLLAELVHFELEINDTLFEKCIEGQDNIIHSKILDLPSTNEQLEILAQRGVNKAIRNISKQYLLKNHYKTS